MSIFDWLFKRHKNVENTVTSNVEEIRQLQRFEADVRDLLKREKYLAKSDYRFICNEYENLYSMFCSLEQTNTLEYYCNSNHIKVGQVKNFIETFIDFQSINSQQIKDHNENFISTHLSSEKKYLDNILRCVDPMIQLDAEQRRVVLSDEDYTLVIAGAGAGKTTTVAAKVKYLVDKKDVKPNEILVISFTNKAVGELQDKINKALKIECAITTFHKTGYAVLHRQEPEKIGIVDGGFIYSVINNYLKECTLKDPDLVDKLILFFGSYFDAPYEGDDLNDFFNYISKADFTTLKGNIGEYTEQIINPTLQFSTLSSTLSAI